MVLKDKNYKAVLDEAKFNVSIVNKSIGRDNDDKDITTKLTQIEGLISQITKTIEEKQGAL